jgi:hypothetical protein
MVSRESAVWFSPNDPAHPLPNRLISLADRSVDAAASVGHNPNDLEISIVTLLPKAGESAKVVAVYSGKLGSEIDGTLSSHRMRFRLQANWTYPA